MDFLRTLLLLLLFAGTAAAADGDPALPAPESAAGPDLADVFDFSLAAKPRPGDWLEYRIAFPEDPLERSLTPDAGGGGAGSATPSPAAAALPAPAASGSASAPAAADPFDIDAIARFEPVFESPAAWRSVPVRIAVREVSDDGCNAEITFAGERRTVRLSAGGEKAHAEFHYDAGGETERTVRVGGIEYAAQEVRRTASQYGFVRWFSPEIPFGTLRFATEHVDIQLVASGRGTPPDFPARAEDEITPPLGKLY